MLSQHLLCAKYCAKCLTYGVEYKLQMMLSLTQAIVSSLTGFQKSRSREPPGRGADISDTSWWWDFFFLFFLNFQDFQHKGPQDRSKQCSQVGATPSLPQRPFML